jgi:hypothetical protein
MQWYFLYSQGRRSSAGHGLRADLEAGMRVYRVAGGNNAVLANVAVDLANGP